MKPADASYVIVHDAAARAFASGRPGAEAPHALLASEWSAGEWIDVKPLGDAQWGELGVSRPGTLAAAIVTPSSREPFLAMSVYGAWENAHSMTKGDFIYADASVHRLISDLSVFAGKKSRQNILVAGDLNILYGHGTWRCVLGRPVRDSI